MQIIGTKNCLNGDKYRFGIWTFGHIVQLQCPERSGVEKKTSWEMWIPSNANWLSETPGSPAGSQMQSYTGKHKWRKARTFKWNVESDLLLSQDFQPLMLQWGENWSHSRTGSLPQPLYSIKSTHAAAVPNHSHRSQVGFTAKKMDLRV